MPARKEIAKTFDQLNLIPINAAAKRYFCSRRQLELAIQAGLIDAYKPGKERMVDIDSANLWFMSKKVKSKEESKSKVGAPRKR